jgi:hypothetical protein
MIPKSTGGVFQDNAVVLRPTVRPKIDRQPRAGTARRCWGGCWLGDRACTTTAETVDTTAPVIACHGSDPRSDRAYTRVDTWVVWISTGGPKRYDANKDVTVAISNHNRTTRITIARILPTYTCTQHNIRIVHGTPLGSAVSDCRNYHIAQPV